MYRQAGWILLATSLTASFSCPRAAWSQNYQLLSETPEELPRGEVTPSVFTLAGLEQVALERNPTLVQAGAQVRISRGKALQAGLYPNPLVGYAGDQLGAEGTAGEFQGVFFEQQLVTAGKLQLSREKFLQEAREAQIQVLAQRYRVLYGVRLAYYTALGRQRRLEIHRRLQLNSEEIVRTVVELENVGQANRTDLLKVQVQLAKARASLQVSERQLQGALEELAAVTALPLGTLVSLDDELDFRSLTPLDRDTVLLNILTCSPELRAARAEVARDQIAVRREQAEPIPNVNVRAESGYNFETNNTVGGIEVGLRVPIFDQNQGTISQARAEVTRARAEVDRVELSLRKRFADVFSHYESARLLASTYRTEALPKAAEVYELYRQSFQARRAAWPQVLETQRDYLDLYEDYLQNLVDARHAEARLNAFLLDDGLQQPPTPTPEGHRDATPKPR